MLTNARGNRLWILDETGEATPVRRPADIHTRPRGRHLPDWWVVEKAPDWRPTDWRPTGETSLLRLGMTQNEDDARRSARHWPGYEHDPGDVPGRRPGGRPGKPDDDLGDDPGDDLGLDPDQAGTGPARGMKIGAGHRLQAYDQHGRYTGPRGGSMPIGGGPVRLFAEDESEGGDEDEPGFEDSAAEDEALEGEVIVAVEDDDSTPTAEQASYEEGGLSGGYEVRGPVSKEVRDPVPPPEKAPAEVTWKNDDAGKPDPKPTDLSPSMQQTVEKMKTKVPKLESFNVNSGRREPLAKHDPHAEGRAVDINTVNGVAVKDLGNAQGERGEKAQQAAANLEAWAKDNPNVNQVIGPNGGWEFTNGTQTDILKTDPRTQGHLNHYHINVWRHQPAKVAR